MQEKEVPVPLENMREKGATATLKPHRGNARPERTRGCIFGVVETFPCSVNFLNENLRQKMCNKYYRQERGLYGEDCAQDSRKAKTSGKIRDQNAEYHSSLVHLCHCIEWGNVYLNFSKAT